MRSLLSLIFILSATSVFAQIPYDFVRDLQQEWMYEKDGRLYPYLGEAGVRVIHFEVNNDDCDQCQLFLNNGEEATLYLDHRPIRLLEPGRHFFSLDSLVASYGTESVMVTVFMSDPGQLTTFLVKNQIDPERFRTSSQIFATPARPNNDFEQFFIIALILILSLFAILRNIYPKMFGEFFLVNRTFSTRNIDEVLFKIRYFDTYNLWMLFLHGLVLSFLLISLNHLTGGMLIPVVGRDVSYVMILFGWFLLTLIMMVLYTAKNILLIIFNTIYKFDFRAVHFYNYMRYSAILGVILLAVIVVFYLGFDLSYERFYRGVVYVATGLFLVRMIVIFLKLMSSQGNTILHLFSYLCATELIPFFFVINVIFRG